MRLRTTLTALGATGSAVFAVTTAAAQPPLPGERIAPGVSVSGVDVGTLTIDEAAVRIDDALRPVLTAREVTVRIGTRSFALSPQEATVELDPLLSAKRALYAGRDRSPVAVSPGATAAGIDVKPVVTHSGAVVRAFVNRVRDAVRRPGRDATLKIGIRRVHLRPGRSGRTVNTNALARQVNAALDDPVAVRALTVKLVPLKPAVSTGELRRQAGTVITIERSSFTLRLFKRARLHKTYKIAVGQTGYPTPTGRFSITSKQVNPTWSVPNSPWAGELAGTSVVGGSAANPLKARWMGIANGVGIHGTGEEYSIGSRASHGCIRMRVKDVIDLYPRVPLGTPVVIR